MAFKERLAQLRHKSGMNQILTAFDLGLAPSTIAGYELGDRYPKLDILYNIALYYKVDLAWLAYGSLLTDEQAEEFRQRFLKAIEGMDPDERQFAYGISLGEVEAFREGGMPLREDVTEDIASRLDLSVDDILKKGEL